MASYGTVKAAPVDALAVLAIFRGRLEGKQADAAAKFLRTFYTSAKEQMLVCDTVSESKEFEDTLHSLKGSTGYVKAPRLFALVTVLYAKCKYPPLGTVERKQELLELVKAEFKTVIEFIDVLLPILSKGGKVETEIAVIADAYSCQSTVPGPLSPAWLPFVRDCARDLQVLKTAGSEALARSLQQRAEEHHAPIIAAMAEGLADAFSRGEATGGPNALMASLERELRVLHDAISPGIGTIAAPAPAPAALSVVTASLAPSPARNGRSPHSSPRASPTPASAGSPGSTAVPGSMAASAPPAPAPAPPTPALSPPPTPGSPAAAPIDIEALVAQFNGNKGFVRSLLGKWQYGVEQRLAKYDKAMRDNDARTIWTEAHSMNGEVGMLKVPDLFAACQCLASATDRREPLAALVPLIERVRSETQRVLEYWRTH